jgi:protein TonB
VSFPVKVREVKPWYTSEAMRAKIQGVVLLECVVLADGTVGDVNVARSLDAVNGLDREAIRAVKRWVFRPAMRNGEPVAVAVRVEMTFTIR